MTNYIEIEQRYTDEHTELSYEVWYAVKPSPGGQVREGKLRLHDWEPWRIGGTELTVSDKEDIAGLRALLDAIEVELDKEPSA